MNFYPGHMSEMTSQMRCDLCYKLFNELYGERINKGIYFTNSNTLNKHVRTSKRHLKAQEWAQKCHLASLGAAQAPTLGAATPAPMLATPLPVVPPPAQVEPIWDILDVELQEVDLKKKHPDCISTIEHIRKFWKFPHQRNQTKRRPIYIDSSNVTNVYHNEEWVKGDAADKLLVLLLKQQHDHLKDIAVMLGSNVNKSNEDNYLRLTHIITGVQNTPENLLHQFKSQLKL